MNHRVYKVASSLILTLVVSCATEPSPRQPSKVTTAKLDPLSEIRFERLRSTGQLRNDDPIALLLEYSTHDKASFWSSRFHCRHKWSNYCLSTIRMNQFDHIVGSSDVVRAEFLGRSQGDTSGLAGKPNTAQSQLGPSAIVSAVIDNGIYWRDEELWIDETSTRIMSLWDQNNHTSSKSTAPSVPYGTEYSATELANFRKDSRVLPSRFGHGLGIVHLSIGKSTLLSRTQSIQNPVILVDIRATKEGILDALNYVISKAPKERNRTVISLAYSSHYGRHDGRDLFTRAVDDLLSPSELLVVPSGNTNSDIRHHIRTNITSETSIMISIDRSECISQKREYFNAELEGWLDGDDDIEVAIRANHGESTDALSFGEIQGSQLSDVSVLLDARLISADTQFRGLGIILAGPCLPEMDPKIDIVVVVDRIGTGDSLIDLWVRDSSGIQIGLSADRGISTNLSALAASHKALVAGAIHIDGDDTLAVAPFSAIGETPDGRSKPDVLVPGAGQYEIASFGELPAVSGTSASAAIVANVAALIWHRHPTASAAEVRSLLSGKVVVPDTYFGQVSTHGSYDVVRSDALLTAALTKLRPQ